MTVPAMPPAQLRVGFLVYGLDRPASGIGRYTIELIRALHALEPSIVITLLQPFPGQIPGLEQISKVVTLPGTRLLPAMMALGPVEIAGAARRHNLDVIHDPTGVSPFLVPRRLSRAAYVVTIHDMVPFVHPETHARLTNILFRRYIPQTLRFIDRVITDSEASARDIRCYFPSARARITRIYCGVSEHFHQPGDEQVASVLGKYGIARPYLLTVGALQARKNLEAAIEAFMRLRDMGLPHRLVVVGRKVWKYEGIFRRLSALGLDDHILLTGFVDDADLPALYAGAACFIFPSLYEGFGLPPLEAMACGTPVVTSNASSLPEVVGDAALMVAPDDIPGLAVAIHRIVAEPGLAEDLRRRGLERARAFTWARAAEEHATLYREVARARRISGA